MSQLLQWLQPWEISIWVQLAVWSSVALYLRGLWRCKTSVSRWRSLSFFIGIGLMYGVSQTYYDYLSQHMFFVHRAQHLVLHHLGPFLIVLAAPASILHAGLPQGLRSRRAPAWLIAAYRQIQSPLLASLLFVGLIYLWLWPAVHFGAMLNTHLYGLMNWSMAIDGLLYWQLMLNHGPPGITPRLGYGKRCILLALGVLPQILIGAYITLVHTELYTVYSVCGRAWSISPLLDQQLGGLLTWIPPAMMHVLAMLLVLRFMMMERRNPDTRSASGYAPYDDGAVTE